MMPAYLLRENIALLSAAARLSALESAPADIEFAFLDGKLVLLQIRPFVESKRAQSSGYLQSLDAGLLERGLENVDMRGVPAPL